MLILDTNALSAAAEHEPSALTVISNAASIELPVIVLGEYRLGIGRSRHRAAYERWLRDWISAVTVLDIGPETTLAYASVALELRTNGTPIPTNDLWIAALCRQYGTPILSRDRHFDLVPGLRRIDW